MNILILGGGGREHAIAWKLAQSNKVERIYLNPGNGSATSDPKIINAPLPLNNEELRDFTLNHDIGLVIPGPEQPLVDGISDYFRKIGVPCFGPSGRAAQIEGSKAFSKQFMTKHHIPTAQFEVFSSFEDARNYIEKVDFPVVVKASGLAAGKGVILPQTKDEAVNAVKEILLEQKFGSAGNEIVIEECLTGEEISVIALTDGYSFHLFPAAQDHKRAFDNDQGPNTGGMGCYAPAPIASDFVMTQITKEIIKPTIDGLRKDGYPFLGALFFGIMLTPSGPKVLEYNCRFGDPETQTLLPLLQDDCDLLDVILAAVEHRLDSVKLCFKEDFSVTVVLASSGYPSSYEKGKKITLPDLLPKGTSIFHAGTKMTNEDLFTNGGRVLSVTSVCSNLPNAIEQTYSTIQHIQFEGAFYRRDIAKKALMNNIPITHLSYASSGVDIDRGNALVDMIKPIVQNTSRLGATTDLGGFGGLFSLKDCGFQDPLLVSATDGVGTKLKIAQDLGIHDSIGIDLVAMNVNDIIVHGAEPLFFLDYFACGSLSVETAASFISGVAQGCRLAGCALVGGETAEMPGFYPSGRYDVAGFAVGAVERDSFLPKLNEISTGDLVIGFFSSGVHSNGFSLIRHIMDTVEISFADPCPFDPDKRIGDVLLCPTKIYVKTLLPLVKENIVKAMAHITGGGLVENIPRVLPKSIKACIDARCWALPPIFKWIMQTGNVTRDEMIRTFNCGIGMVLIISPKDLARLHQLVPEQDYAVIGQLDDRLDGRPVEITGSGDW